MKISLQIPNFTWQGGASRLGAKLADIARLADDAGFSSIWVMDHFFQIGYWFGPAEADMLDAYSTLAYFAAITKKVKLGTLVTGVIYHNPGAIIKTVTTLDVLSGGRAYLGVGAGWYEREALGMGLPFPPAKERLEQLEETLEICRQMWSPDNGPYEGKHFNLKETICQPQPLAKPHPPILIGGGGEKKTLKLVAKYADASNLFGQIGIDALRHKNALIDQYCREIGRDPGEVERSTLNTAEIAPGKMTAAQVMDECHALEEIGIRHVIFNMPNLYEMTPLEIFGKQIIPALQ